MRWNIVQIFEELKAGLRKAAHLGEKVESLSVDSWGLDYVLLGASQPMLSLPYHYRDARTDATYAAAMKSPGAEFIFAESGIQFMPVNTLYQLAAERQNSPALLEVADQFLTIADYFHYLFSGVAAVEESLASTTQLFHPVEKTWSRKLMKAFSLPEKIFPRLVPPATKLGSLLPEIASETRSAPLDVIAGCSHDTAAAVAATPGAGEDWAYLSSGTWSLLGVELDAPLLSDAAREHNFTNEAGIGGKTRFLKNIAGLWILQECRRSWKKDGQEIDYAALGREAEAAEPFRSLINPAAPQFLKPDAMPEKVADFCRESGQPIPETVGQFTRCIFESLALSYAKTLDELEIVTDKSITRLHIIGGGSQSRLLNQFAANASGRAVIAGPVEATAMGNLLVQAVALGHLGSLAELRDVVRASVEIQQFEPAGGWENARARFGEIC